MPRCSECRAQTDMPYQCRHCGDQFCSDHRLPDDHSCSTAGSDTLDIFDDGDENDTPLEFADDDDGIFSSITDLHGSINIILLFIFSIITARILAVIFPSVPSGGLSTAPGAQVSVYGSSIYQSNPDLVLKLIAVVQYEAYAVIPLIVLAAILLARFKKNSPFNSEGPSSSQMRNSYVIIGLWIGIPLLPIVLIGVFGVRFFGITFIPSFLPSSLHQNFAVLSAPIFLLSMLVDTITKALGRKLTENNGA